MLKFDTSAHSTLIIMGSLLTDTKPYFPGLLTCANNVSVGAFTCDWCPPPAMYTNGYAYLDLDQAQDAQPTIRNLRFSFADQAVTTPSGSGTLDIWDCQFVQCNAAIVNNVTNGPSANRLHNVLFAQCRAAVQAAGAGATIAAEQVTADVTNFWTGQSPACLKLDEQHRGWQPGRRPGPRHQPRCRQPHGSSVPGGRQR